MEDFFLELAEFLSADQILKPDNINIKPFIIEKRGNFTSNPCAVILPYDTKQASQIVKSCIKHNIKIVPQGGNSGLTGGCVANHHQIILSSKLMNKIIEVNPTNFSMEVESGVVLEDIHHRASQHNLLFPLDLASKKYCTIGGNIATNAGGINVLKYGNTKDLILGLEAILPNGEIYSDLNLLRKRNMGSDFKSLFCASEGLIGFITKANIKLFIPPLSSMNVCFGCNEIKKIEEIFLDIKRLYSESLSSYEILNKNSMDLVEDYKVNLNIPIANNNHWYAMFSIESMNNKDSIFNLEMEKQIKELFKNHGLNNYFISQNKDMWELRYNLPDSQKQLGTSLKHDISLPLDKIIVILEELTNKLITQYPHIIPTIFGHFGDGNIHYNISSKNEVELKLQKQAIKDIIIEEILKNNGTFSAEHGIGLLHKTEFKNYYFNNQYNGLKLIKNMLDKHNIFNDDKIF
jgi:FAD/FMN-containing dehydrogenase